MLTLTLKLVEDIPTINGRILNAFRLQLNSVLKRAAPAIQRRIGDVCESLIKKEQQYTQLLTGPIYGDLGVVDMEGKLEHILDTVKKSCEVEFTPIVQAGNQLTGGLVIKMIRSDFLDVLGLPDAEYATDKGTVIPWLNWVLTQGDRIIIIGYDVKLNLTPREKVRSRTGFGLMEKEPGQGWRVPPAVAGTIDDNFITKAFDGGEVERLLLTIVEQEIASRID